MFSTAMVDYKKSENIDTVCEVLTGLFVVNTDTYHLFRSKFLFSTILGSFVDVCILWGLFHDQPDSLHRVMGLSPVCQCNFYM